MIYKLPICHIVSGDLWAGAEVMVFNLLTELNRNPALQIHAIILNHGKLATELSKNGINVFVIEESKNPFFSIAFKIFKYILKHRIKVVHSHRYKENILSVISTLLLPPISRISTIHGLPEVISHRSDNILNWSKKSNLNYLLLKYLFKWSVCVSHESAGILIKASKLKQTKLKIVHNGIQMNTFNKTQPKSNNRSEFIIGTACRLVPIKNIAFLINIAVSLKGSNLRIKIAGDGPLRKTLEAQCKETKTTEIIEFCGNIIDMATFYNSIDIFVNSSLHEGIPMTVLEAMSNHLPVVAPAIGGIPEIIEDNVSGFLVQPYDSPAFIECIMKLSTNSELCVHMGHNARKRVEENFSISVCADQYYNLYKMVT
jgi:glycosyltransferase involved in cell wall biosynthesis